MIDLKIYQDTQNSDQSDQDLLRHIGLVKRVAVHLKARVPNFMELDELIQVGMIGLIEANNSFDPGKGVEFEVFAKNRIRGAILDQVRKLSHLPRSAISNIRDHNQAGEELSSKLGRQPTQSELAEFMGKDIEDFHKERTHAHRFQTLSLESQGSEMDELPSTASSQPESEVADNQLKAALVESIQALPERERMVISLYYVEEMNLKEIGAILEVSESRVSQILSVCVKKLRAHMGQFES
jgi:RNA polymerase sigma factor for flagellar operon FliA